jgi:plasmid stabilization system protein ParE
VAAGDRIQEFVDLLETSPYLGHEGDIPGTREITVVSSKSVVLYRVEEDDSIVILRVFPGGRQRPTRL